LGAPGGHIYLDIYRSAVVLDVFPKDSVPAAAAVGRQHLHRRRHHHLCRSRWTPPADIYLDIYRSAVVLDVFPTDSVPAAAAVLGANISTAAATTTSAAAAGRPRRTYI